MHLTSPATLPLTRNSLIYMDVQLARGYFDEKGKMRSVRLLTFFFKKINDSSLKTVKVAARRKILIEIPN